MNEIKLDKVLKRELKARNESINSLSRETGIPSSCLHNWTQGTLPSGKNMHHLQALSDYFGISLSMLLFSKRVSDSDETILFSSTFMDGDMQYKLTIEKVKR